jgi:hypothetical protein
MRRREFITLLGGAMAAWSLAARAQQSGRIPRVAVLMATAESDPEIKARVNAFRQGLDELGWTDGRNIRIEYRFAAGDATQLQAYAAELVPWRSVDGSHGRLSRWRDCWTLPRKPLITPRCAFGIGWSHMAESSQAGLPLSTAVWALRVACNTSTGAGPSARAHARSPLC